MVGINLRKIRWVLISVRIPLGALPTERKISNNNNNKNNNNNDDENNNDSISNGEVPFEYLKIFVHCSTLYFLCMVLLFTFRALFYSLLFWYSVLFINYLALYMVPWVKFLAKMNSFILSNLYIFLIFWSTKEYQEILT